MVHSVQYLRGIAALMVLVEHVGVKSSQFSTNLLSNWHVGGAGVDLFFLISGFIMCHTTEDKHQQTGAARHFLWRRIVRIIPLYWLVTCAALLIFVIAPDKINSQGGETGLLASFFLLPTDQLYLVSNGWTLRYEFLFYLIFMFGLFFSKYLGQIIVLITLATLSVLGLFHNSDNVVVKFITDTLLVEFAAGMLLYHIYQYFQHKKTPPTVLPFICFGLAFGGLIAVNQGVSSGMRVIDFGLPMLCFMVGALSLEPILRQRPIVVLKMLGDSSYAMYLTHPFLLAGGAMILSKLQLTHTLGGAVFVGLLFVGAIVAGYLVYELIEKPMGRKLSAFQWPSSAQKTATVKPPVAAQKS